MSHRSSLTTSTTPRIWVPRHVARPVTRLVAPPVVDYSASRRIVVDYFASAARPSASARRAAPRAARRRLLSTSRVSGCLSTSHGSLSTTSPVLRVRVPCSLRSSLSTTSPMLCDRVPRPLARLVVDLAPSLPLNFLSVGRTGSRRAPVTPSRGSGACLPDALAQLPMSCIRTRRLHCLTTRHRSYQQSAQAA
jgi:hypothetical protein